MVVESIKSEVSPQDFVGKMLCDYLWINLRGVRRRVDYSHDTGLRSLWGGNSLLESIYALVTDAATSGRLAQCAECGSTFVQTDERQHYCPPRDDHTKSTCMNRARVRRQRHKRKHQPKRSIGHGKPTRQR